MEMVHTRYNEIITDVVGDMKYLSYNDEELVG